MNFKPILFSTPMVQAILDGRKTQTRRVIKPQPLDVVTYANQRVWYPEVIKCPYGEIGDVLWVRETFIKDKESFLHKASHTLVEKFIKWKPSIFMPKEACRLFLQVKNIRVEQLQDITEEDAFAEGAKHGRFYGLGQIGGSTREGFFELWETINKKGSVNKNPWVWVIEFEKIEKPENFI